MDIALSYSEEKLNSYFSKTNQIFDVVQLLLISADDQEKMLKEIAERVLKVEQSASDINSKLDTILDMLTRLENEFEDIKSEHRDLEQKLMLMISKLQKLEDSIPDEKIDDYRELAKSLYANWESLDALTKKYIPLADYLYSKLQKIDRADYSPVILELCRAIENELLLKIFKKYTLECIRLKGRNLNAFLANDRADPRLTIPTGQFVKAISRAAKSGKPEYTLGQMKTILSMINDSQIVQISPLLQDFENYLNNNTEATLLLDSDYLAKIEDIVNDYRNPSAHPDFMSIQKADECRKIMPERIDYLMDCVI